jgi:2-furoyl-CoA dehydrogenase 2Fe-2S iron sulfur subunit
VTDRRHIKVRVNGSEYERVVETRVTLADFLRHDIGLTGTHVGCEHGVCGACTVLVNGRSSRSCLMLAVQAQGHEIRTVEGLAAADGTLSALQQAFWEMHALQCGFCTAGMLMTLTELLATNLTPSKAEIRERIAGNICRCTGYQSIVAAALLAAERLRRGSEVG